MRDAFDVELGAPIDKLPLPNRARRWLRLAGIRTLGDLLRRTRDDLLVIANFSQTSLEHVERYLNERGLKLSPRRKAACPVDWVRDALADSVLTLDRRERDVLRLRHGVNVPRPHTLQECGKRFKVTRERVRQVQKTAELKVISHMIFVRGLHLDGAAEHDQSS